MSARGYYSYSITENKIKSRAATLTPHHKLLRFVARRGNRYKKARKKYRLPQIIFSAAGDVTEYVCESAPFTASFHSSPPREACAW
jgi:hypothetical protein